MNSRKQAYKTFAALPWEVKAFFAVLGLAFVSGFALAGETAYAFSRLGVAQRKVAKATYSAWVFAYEATAGNAKRAAETMEQIGLMPLEAARQAWRFWKKGFDPDGVMPDALPPGLHSSGNKKERSQ